MSTLKGWTFNCRQRALGQVNYINWQSDTAETGGCILLLKTAEHKGVVNKLFKNIIEKKNYRIFEMIFKIHKQSEQLPTLI